MTSRPALRLGLTGGIGSGKSTVARMLEVLGATVIDADAIARACTASGGQAIPAISEAFGVQFITSQGALDREQMRALVFKQPSARQTLEAIIHPRVGDEIRRQSDAVTSRCIVFDIPLLVESPHWRPKLDRVLVIDCLPITQKARVHARSGWSNETIDAAIHSQTPRAVRMAAADSTIFNEGLTLAQLQCLVTRVAPAFGL